MRLLQVLGRRTLKPEPRDIHGEDDAPFGKILKVAFVISLLAMSPGLFSRKISVDALLGWFLGAVLLSLLLAGTLSYLWPLSRWLRTTLRHRGVMQAEEVDAATEARVNAAFAKRR